ncbi:hypothetical protein SAMN05192534_1335 [Alteribacillus persepolensis]|uniref:Uncharacterized protein n=1 Tax=Alteribacillus persepolensis TaxID=568899 RepID=A0A1G8JGK8_9BACI|nr:hypothetical protein SAMN05192534_1335 [Alteribacillus persepolensis]
MSASLPAAIVGGDFAGFAAAAHLAEREKSFIPRGYVL